nr:uncharacterized protein LOC109176682 [Ipomoea trifida]
MVAASFPPLLVSLGKTSSYTTINNHLSSSFTFVSRFPLSRHNNKLQARWSSGGCHEQARWSSGKAMVNFAQQAYIVAYVIDDQVGDWFVKNSRLLNKSQNNLLLIICWYIWYARNEKTWNNVNFSPKAILEKAKAHLLEWTEVQAKDVFTYPQQPPFITN